MSKKTIKEIIIILLITLAIILILGVLLYEYIPSNKIIPEKISYTTPENIKEELANGEEQNNTDPIMTYRLEPTDINNYRRIDSYVPGKVNPFSSVIKDVEENNEDNSTNNSISGSNSTSNNGATTTIPNTNTSNSNNNTSSEGRFLPNRGTK